jgi:hypothetical protein
LAGAALASFPTICSAESSPVKQTAPTEERKPSKTVTIEDDVIYLHPGTRLTKPDQKELNRILARYDKSLYKIETYKKGEVKRTQGELNDMLINRRLAAEAADAKAKGYSNRTLQIIAATTSQRLLGTTTNPQQTPGTTTNPQNIQQTPGTTTNPQNIQQTPGTTTNPQNIQQTPGTTTNPQNIQHTPGATTNPQTSPSATTNPQRQSPPPVGEKASRELIERLKPILEKYSRE